MTKPPCRLCSDFQDIVKGKKPVPSQGSDQDQGSGTHSVTATEEIKVERDAKTQLPCPPTSRELGRSTWTFLHTTAAKYPDQPTNADRVAFKNLMHSLAQLYPCSYCAHELQQDLKKHPDIPDQNRNAVEEWMCQLHNRVNKRLGKPEFNCKLAHERWLTGCSDFDESG